MQIAFEVFRGMREIPEDKREEYTINTFRIPFAHEAVENGTVRRSKPDSDREPTAEEIAYHTAMAKAVWAARLGAYGPGAVQVTVPAESGE